MTWRNFPRKTGRLIQKVIANGISVWLLINNHSENCARTTHMMRMGNIMTDPFARRWGHENPECSSSQETRQPNCLWFEVIEIQAIFS